MTIRQLRPEQKKLWRRVCLQAGERGLVPGASAKEADDMVTLWEERGAFDEGGDWSTVLRGGAIANAGYAKLALTVAHHATLPNGETSALPVGSVLRMDTFSTGTGYMQSGGTGFKL